MNRNLSVFLFAAGAGVQGADFKGTSGAPEVSGTPLRNYRLNFNTTTSDVNIEVFTVFSFQSGADCVEQQISDVNQVLMAVVLVLLLT
jgi:hypothetical protein